MRGRGRAQAVVAAALVLVSTIVILQIPAGAGEPTTAPTVDVTDTGAPALTVAPVIPSLGPVPTAPTLTEPTSPVPRLLDDEEDSASSGPPTFLIAGLVLSLVTAAVIGIALLVLQRRSSRSDKQSADKRSADKQKS